MSSLHECPKRQCTCWEVSELTKLYRELKCQRERAAASSRRKDNDDEEEEGGGGDEEERECVSTEQLQMTRGQAEHVLGIVRTQRQGVNNLMTALRDFNEKLSKQEEMLYLADKEIAELRDEMRQMNQRHDDEKNVVVVVDDNATSAEELAWRQALDVEIHVRCRLKNEIKQSCERLECRERRERGIDEARQHERRVDAKLLLNAINYVEKCIPESGSC